LTLISLKTSGSKEKKELPSSRLVHFTDYQYYSLFENIIFLLYQRQHIMEILNINLSFAIVEWTCFRRLWGKTEL